mgnify:FL=1
MGDAKDEREKNIFIRDENVSGVGDDLYLAACKI